jgi:hypothetical protein
MKDNATTLVVMVGFFLAAALSHGSEAKKQNAGTLTAVNESGKATVFSPKAIAKLPRITVKAKTHSGALATYEGVSLAEVLRSAGITLGKGLKGPLLANCLLVEASDGYRVVFSLAEVDPAWTENVVLLADRKDGKPLDAKEGLFRLVAPRDKKQGRWVRQVIRISVTRVGGEKSGH